jgi:hypothetical protein
MDLSQNVYYQAEQFLLWREVYGISIMQKYIGQKKELMMPILAWIKFFIKQFQSYHTQSGNSMI